MTTPPASDAILTRSAGVRRSLTRSHLRMSSVLRATVAVIVVALCTACGAQSSSGTSTSTSPATSSATTSSVTTLPSPVQSQPAPTTTAVATTAASSSAVSVAPDAAHTATTTTTDSNGFKLTYTIQISDWIQGSNSPLLNSTWLQFGGAPNQMPLIDGSYSWGGGGPKTLVQNDAAYLVGKISIKNASPGFTPPSGRTPTLRIACDGKNDKGDANCLGGEWGDYFVQSGTATMKCVQYGSSANPQMQCTADYGDTGLATAQMTSDAWGPVPFVIALAGALTKTPNNPQGNPAFDTVKLTFGDATVSPTKTW